MNMRKFHSSYIIDVSIDHHTVVITDSIRCHWYIDIKDDDRRLEFKNWMQVFLRGVSQTLTVFEYEQRGEVPNVENWIIKFHGLKHLTQLDG